MRITRARIVCVLLMVLVSIIIANFLKLISVENERREPFKSTTVPVIDGSGEHLMWFTQVSDLHLSFIQDEGRGAELLELCDDTMKIIQPSVILVTGDLTDAKKRDAVGSTQVEEEWQQYKSILNKCRTLRNVPWLDIRGNHDNFDVPSILSSRNFFRNFSMQGQRHSRSYVHKVTSGGDRYAFIGLDACPAVGLKRPFNFVGILPEAEVLELKKLIQTVNDVDHTIWFGHYPTSCIMSHQPGVRSVIASDNKSLAYLCGHFHTMLGVVPHMYTLQKEGFYELELADWKDNRMFRVVAIDHGLLSFVDIKFRDWPIVLVTNPKNALFQAPEREPLDAMSSSTHIRLLVFNPSKVESVAVSLDGGEWKSASQVGSGPLHTVPWRPAHLSAGLHSIMVQVRDVEGREKTVSQTFSLDGSRLDFKVLPRILLMLNFTLVMQVMYGLAVACCVLPYCYFRYMNKQALECEAKLPVWRNTFLHRWVRRVWIVSNIDTLFYPIVFYPLYISVGPWAVAEVLTGQYGVIFIWGVILNDGTVVLLTLTYTYAFIQLFLFHGPLVTFTAYAVEKRLCEAEGVRSRSSGGDRLERGLKACRNHLPYLVLLGSQLLMAYSFLLAYGPWAVLAGPIRLWPLAQVFWVWYQTRTLPLWKMKSAARVWEKVSGTLTS